MLKKVVNSKQQKRSNKRSNKTESNEIVKRLVEASSNKIASRGSDLRPGHNYESTFVPTQTTSVSYGNTAERPSTRFFESKIEIPKFDVSRIIPEHYILGFKMEREQLLESLKNISEQIKNIKPDFLSGRLRAGYLKGMKKMSDELYDVGLAKTKSEAIADLADASFADLENSGLSYNFGRGYQSILNFLFGQSEETFNSIRDQSQKDELHYSQLARDSSEKISRLRGLNLYEFYRYLKGLPFEIPTFDHKVDFSKMSYAQLLKFLSKHKGPDTFGKSYLHYQNGIIDFNGKPAMESGEGYKSTFTEGDYSVPIFSDNAEVNYLTGSLSSSESKRVNTYSITGNLLQEGSSSYSKPASIPKEYLETTRNNINYINNRFGGNLISYGSSDLVNRSSAPHVTHDYDFYITREDFEKYVRPELDSGKSIFDSSDGPTGKENRITIIMDGTKYGENIKDKNHPGRIDFNIIDNNMFSSAGGKESRALLIFRLFFPELYKQEAIRLRSDPHATMRMPSNELLWRAAKENADVLSIIDSFEASGRQAGAETSFGKHIGRWPELILSADPKTMDKAILIYARSLYGPNALIPSFGIEHYSNPELNLQLLKSINFPGNIELIAKSPEATRNAFNLWYVGQSGYIREFSYFPTKDARSLWERRDSYDYGPWAGSHELSLFSGFTEISPVTTNHSAGGHGLDVVSFGVARPHTFPGMSSDVSAGNNGNHLRNGGVLFLRNFEDYSDPMSLVKVLDEEMNGNIPITNEQIELLNQLGYRIPLNTKTVREALDLQYEGYGIRDSFNKELLDYINTQWPNLKSRLLSWYSGYKGIDNVYGTGYYRMMLRNPQPNEVAWTFGIAPMISEPITRQTVNGFGHSEFYPKTDTFTYELKDVDMSDSERTEKFIHSLDFEHLNYLLNKQSQVVKQAQSEYDDLRNSESRAGNLLWRPEGDWVGTRKSAASRFWHTPYSLFVPGRLTSEIVSSVKRDGLKKTVDDVVTNASSEYFPIFLGASTPYVFGGLALWGKSSYDKQEEYRKWRYSPEILNDPKLRDFRARRHQAFKDKNEELFDQLIDEEETYLDELYNKYKEGLK